MKISKTKYFKVIGKIHAESLPPVLKEAHGVIMSKTNFGEDWSLYNKDMELTRLINLVYTKAEELIKSNRSYLTPKDAAMHLLKDPVIRGEDFDDLPNKKLSVKNSEYAAHIEGNKVIVTMLYGTTIRETFYIEDLIPEVLNTYLSEGDRKRIAKTRRVFNHKQPEFRILKAVLAWEERLVTRSMVTSLLELIAASRRDKTLKSNSPVAKEIKLVEAKLKAIFNVMADSITVRFSPETKRLWRVALKKVTDPGKKDDRSKGQTLSGIEAAPSEKSLTIKPNIISSEDFARTEFKTIGLKGKWLLLMGDPCPGFKAAVSGMPKMGKSFLCVEFAKYLASNHGKVIYITKEEFMSPTFQIKIKEKNAANPNLDIAGEIPANLSDYQFIFIDSVTSLKLTPSDLRKLEENNPGKSFIYVHQVTKAGKARGTNEFLHNVDIIIEVPERGKATQYGRYNQGGEMDIFQSESPAPSVSGLDGISKKSKRYAVEGSAFVYVIDLDERGSFRAHVEDSAGNTVFEIAAGTELEEGESSIFEDGFMKHNGDIRGLEKHLKDLQIITPEDWLVDGEELNGEPEGDRPMEIEAEIVVPYELVSMALFADKQSDEEIERFEEEQPEKLDETIKEICEDELSGSRITVMAIRRVALKGEMDGFFSCKVTLKGMESDLRERVGEGEIFMYDWSKSEQGMTNSYFKKLQSKKK